MWLRSLFLGVLTWTIPVICFAQIAPGGVQGSSVWYDLSDDVDVLGNHHTFDLLDFEAYLKSNPSVFQETTTYFFVFRPTFSSSTGLHFMTIGNVDIYDDRIEYNGISKPIQFVVTEPKIITITAPARRYYGRRPPATRIQVHDSSLFSMAEVLLFPDRLNRVDIHKVNSYLALKYSVTITQNSVSKWRSYWGADSTLLYWNSQIDRLFDQRVIGIGNSQDERFDQTQTCTSEGDFLLVSLDTVKPLGQMPNVSVSEDAFIVFSERLPLATSTPLCAFDISASNPMRNWKFILHDWSSPAEHMFIRVKKPKGNLADSLFLWDGYQTWHLPHTIVDSNTVEYMVYFDMLQNGVHYFFIQQQNLNCPNVNVTVDPTLGTVKVAISENELDSWSFETHSLKTGITTSQTVLGSFASRQLEEGQHILSIKDSDGNEVMSKVIGVSNEGNASDELASQVPSLKLFPVPVKANREAILSIENLPSSESIRLVVNDNLGRILRNDELEYHSGMEVNMTFPISGYYTVTVVQNNIYYSLKAIVTQ